MLKSERKQIILSQLKQDGFVTLGKPNCFVK